jgi:DNA-binding Lrp family transcriptional regulator
VELVRLLQEDGRQPLARLARRLETPIGTVTRRITALRSARVIDISAVTGLRALGYDFAALLGLRLDGRDAVPEVFRKLWRIPSVDYASLVGGPYDAIVQVVAEDEAQFLDILDGKIRRLEGIRDVEVHPYLSMYFQRYRYPDLSLSAADEGDGALLDAGAFDETDKRIIIELCRDGRLPFHTIGDLLGVSESQVRRRVRRMTASGGLRIMALANPISLGFSTIAWLAIRVIPGKKVRQVAEELSQVREVTYIALPSGRFDIFAELIARSKDDLMRLLEDSVRSIEGVQRVEVWLHLGAWHWRPLRPERPA